MARRGAFVRKLAVSLTSLALTLLALELLTRAFGPGSGVLDGESPFATYTNQAPVFELREEHGVRAWRRTRFHWIPGPQEFREQKDSRGLRVFSLGGSAAMGWPHPPRRATRGFWRRS